MPTEAETAAAAAVAAAAAAQGDKWFKDFDPDTLGYMQNRGLDKKDAKTAFAETVKAHKLAEEKLGVPADKIVRLLEPNATPEQKKEFWKRLGAPNDAKDYDFKDVVRTINGKQVPLDEKLTDFIRNIAGSSFLPKETAVDLAQGFAKYQDALDAAAAAGKAATIATEQAALKTSWSAKYDANMFIANQAAGKSGFTPEQVKALESVAGYASVMEAFRRFGMATGEGRFLMNESAPDGAVMTIEAAKDAKATLMADKAFLKKLTSGDAEAKKKMSDLNLILSGVLNKSQAA